MWVCVVCVCYRDRSTEIDFDLACKVNNSWLGNFSSLTKTHTHTYTPPTAVLVYSLFCLETPMLGDDWLRSCPHLGQINLKTLFLWDNYLRPHSHFMLILKSSPVKNKHNRRTATSFHLPHLFSGVNKVV